MQAYLDTLDRLHLIKSVNLHTPSQQQSPRGYQRDNCNWSSPLLYNLQKAQQIVNFLFFPPLLPSLHPLLLFLLLSVFCVSFLIYIFLFDLKNKI